MILPLFFLMLARAVRSGFAHAYLTSLVIALPGLLAMLLARGM